MCAQFCPPAASLSDPAPSLPSLVGLLVSLLVETPSSPSPDTYPLVLEGCRLLTTLLCPVLYCLGKPAHQLTAWRELMAGETAHLAVPLTCSLLIRFMEQGPAPPRPAESGSLVLGLASGVWNILTLGYGGAGEEEVGEGGETAPLAGASLRLLLLLVNHCTDTDSFSNPYRLLESNTEPSLTDTFSPSGQPWPPLATRVTSHAQLLRLCSG